MVVLGEGGGVGGWGGVGFGWGGNNGERKKVCFKMHFRQKKVFLDHVFFFFLMENQVIGDPPTLS